MTERNVSQLPQSINPAPDIQLEGRSVWIRELVVDSSEVHAFLERAEPEEWAALLTRAIRIGVVALERAAISVDIDAIRTETKRLLEDVEAQVAHLPGKIETELTGKLGTGDGQALKPVKEVVDRFKELAEDRIQKVERIVDEKLDPSRQGSTIYEALKAVDELLDGDRDSSIQGQIREVMRKASTVDGQLGQAVQNIVRKELEATHGRIDSLLESMGVKIGRDEIIEKSTYAGEGFELEVLERLCEVFGQVGCSIDHVGPQNLPGDVLLTFTEVGEPYRIIVEAKRDRSGDWGPKPLSDFFDKAMTQWEAQWGVFVAPSKDAFSQGVGNWHEGQCSLGPWIATTLDQLIPAVRLQRIRIHQQSNRINLNEIAVDDINGQIKNIQRQIQELSTASASIQDAIKSAKSGGGALDKVKWSISQSLRQLELLLGVPVTATSEETPEAESDGADIPVSHADVLQGVAEDLICKACGEPIERNPGARGRKPERHPWCRGRG